MTTLRVLLILLFASSVDAATYTVSPTTTTVDGRTYCGGSPCTGNDTIIIEGGTRQGLLLRNFDGNGSYITVTNENATPDKQVVMEGNPSGGYGILNVQNSQWLDVRGDGDPDLDYGIRTIMRHGTATERVGNVWMYGTILNYVKMGYIDITYPSAMDDYVSDYLVGMRVMDGDNNDADPRILWDTIEIHHNRVDGPTYSGFYVGQMYIDNGTQLKNVSIHDNTLTNLGTYGFGLKGTIGPSQSFVYNNYIENTGMNSYWVDRGDRENKMCGITTENNTEMAEISIYDNTTMYTRGPGVQLIEQGLTTDTVEIYGNTILGAGTNNHETFGSGVAVYDGFTANVYDNTIIQPTRYGVYAKVEAVAVYVDRNNIGDAGLGQATGYQPGGEGIIVEGTGEDANIYHADVADFGFCEWSDDGNYKNDNFNFPPDCDDTGGGETPGLANGASLLM